MFMLAVLFYSVLALELTLVLPLILSFQVAFLRYIQQWKKKVVFVLNKSDLYRNANEVCDENHSFDS